MGVGSRCQFHRIQFAFLLVQSVKVGKTNAWRFLHKIQNSSAHLHIVYGKQLSAFIHDGGCYQTCMVEVRIRPLQESNMAKMNYC